MLTTITAYILEEVPKFPENESLYVSNKNHDICSNGDIDDDAQYFETPIKHNHINMSLIVKDSK